MSNKEAVDVILNSYRAEYNNNPLVYEKAIRSTLLALGYDEDYITGIFHDLQDHIAKMYNWR